MRAKTNRGRVKVTGTTDQTYSTARNLKGKEKKKTQGQNNKQ